jgi:uncharacterized SAM-binding protein YcdF (DUF218 family)
MFWVLGLMVLALWTSNKNRRKRCIICALGIFYFFGNHFTVKVVSSLWGFESITFEDIQEPYDLGIVLTGYSVMNPELTNFDHFHHFNQSANRLTQSIELYKSGKVKKLLICGGSGHLFGEKASEGRKTLTFLLKMGIPREDILLEPKSRNTIENAQYAKRFLDEIENEINFNRVLLLTSNFHMYRSKRCFDKAGLEVTPFSLGHQPSKIDLDIADFLLDSGALNQWCKMIREWAAIATYSLLGYI